MAVGTILNLDVWTLVRKGVSRTLSGIHSIVPLLVALSALIASCITGLLQIFGPSWIPRPSEFVTDLDFVNTGLSDLVMYSIDSSTLLLILDGMCRFAETAIPFAITWLASFCAFSWVVAARSGVRRQIKDFLER